MARMGGSIGRLRHRVEWQTPSPRTQGTTGQQKANFSTVGTTWGEVVPAGTFEKFGHAQQYANSTHGVRFRLQSMPDAKHDWRIVWKGRVFEIIGVVVAPDPQQFSWAECVELLESTEDP